MDDGLKSDSAPPTLHDVAREAGVSVATASRALNGSVRNVRSENAQRVQAAADRLGYQPHLSAQAIARGSTPSVALVVRDVADPYFSEIAAGVVHVAEQARLIVTMAVADGSPERELEIVRTLRGQRPRAIVVAGSRVDGAPRDALVAELAEYRTAGGRVVMISQRDLPFATITIDNREGAGRLARALIDLGYRNFAVFHAPAEVRTSRDRHEGFAAAVRAAGLPEPLAIETAFTKSGGYEAAQHLAHRGLADVEAVFAVNDVMAIGAMTAFRDAGLIPGADIGVAGFDDIASAVDVVPALTSVAVPLREVGQTAMCLALSEESAPDEVGLPIDVVLRDSTPPRTEPSA